MMSPNLQRILQDAQFTYQETLSDPDTSACSRIAYSEAFSFLLMIKKELEDAPSK